MAKKKTTSDSQLKVMLIILIVLAGFFVYYVLKSSSGTTPEQLPGGPKDQDKTTGHGGPAGPHYNLNLIGVPKNKKADMKGGGSRIFVRLEGKTRIDLGEGDDFYVVDPNGTDGRARFELPNPDPDSDGVTEYSVWARALGKPGGESSTTTCATDTVTGDEYCSVYSMVLVREKGKSSFSDVSKQLLYVYVDLDLDGNLERYPLFDDALQDYFWSYDNKGMKLVQLRFYENIPSDVN